MAVEFPIWALGAVLVFITGYFVGWGKGHHDGYEYGRELGETLGYSQAMREQVMPPSEDDND